MNNSNKYEHAHRREDDRPKVITSYTAPHLLADGGHPAIRVIKRGKYTNYCFGVIREAGTGEYIGLPGIPVQDAQVFMALLQGAMSKQGE